jgi:integrase
MNATPRKQTWQVTKIPNLYLLAESKTYYLRVKPKGKKRFRISLQTDNFAVARERMRQHLVKLEEPTIASGGTWGSLVEAYMVHLEGKKLTGKLTESSISYKEEAMKQIQKTWPDWQKMPLADVTEAGLAKWAVTHRASYSATRTNGAITVTRELLALAVRDKILPRARVEDVLHGLQYTEVDYDYKRMTLALPEPEQVRQLRNEVYRRCKMKGTLGGYLFDLLLFSGVRIDSARHILRSDVHRDKGIMFVRQAKTGSYTVPLFDDLLELVDRIEKNLPGKPTDKLVPTVTLQVVLASACKAVKIPHLSHHDLRHIFATRCIESGVDIPTVAAWLGHKDGGRTAMLIYGHLRQTHSVSQAKGVKFLPDRAKVAEAVKVAPNEACLNEKQQADEPCAKEKPAGEGV